MCSVHCAWSSAAMSLWKASLFSIPYESVEWQGFLSISLHFLKVGKSIFLSISSSLSLSWWYCKELDPLCQWTCSGHLRAGHNNHVSFWAHWQVCSAAGWFLKVARPVHVLWVMSQQGIHVITLNTVVTVLPLLEVPCMISRTILNSACAGVIPVAADHFGIGLCFQLFLLCFQLLIAQLAVEILSFKAFDVLN